MPIPRSRKGIGPVGARAAQEREQRVALLSLANLTVPDADPLRQIEAAAAAGFDAVGLCLNPSDRPGASLVRDAAERRRVRQCLTELDMRVLDVEIFPLEPLIEVKALTPALAAGAELGAEFLLVTGNDEDEARVCDNYAALCDLAAPFRLRPMLEFITWRPLRDIHQGARWLRRAARPAGGMCIDALHLFRSGGTIADLRRIDPADIGYVQLADATTLEPAERFSEAELMHEARSDRRLPGHGVLPLAAFLRALRPGLAISVEAPCAAHAPLSVEERASLAMEATRPVLSEYLARPLSESGPARRA
jgi:sugar phosphate isomerase/epimerase